MILEKEAAEDEVEVVQVAVAALLCSFCVFVWLFISTGRVSLLCLVYDVGVKEFQSSFLS